MPPQPRSCGLLRSDNLQVSGVKLARQVQSLAANGAGIAENIQNEILLGLPRKEGTSILSKSKFVPLPARTVLTEMSDPIEFCYFLNSGVVSIIHVMTDGKSVEVGLTGKEGFVGLPLIVGYGTSPTRAIIQIEATGYKIRAQDLKNALVQLSRARGRFASLLPGIIDSGDPNCRLQPPS